MHKIKSSDLKYNLKIFTAFIYYASKVLRKILQISIISFLKRNSYHLHFLCRSEAWFNSQTVTEISHEEENKV